MSKSTPLATNPSLIWANVNMSMNPVCLFAFAILLGQERASWRHAAALLAEYEKDRRHVVFAARTKRMESVLFRVCYQLYRLVHRALTGIEVRVGNFSVAPRAALTRLMGVPDVWNHYAAAIHRARIPRKYLPLARGKRLAGESKMNFTSLLVHGLTAMSVFSDQVSARLLTLAVGFATTAASAIAAGTISNPQTNHLVAGHFNGDGRLDLVSTDDSSLGAIVLWRTKGFPSPEGGLFVGSSSFGIAVADLDGNGVEDLVGLQGPNAPQVGMPLIGHPNGFTVKNFFISKSFFYPKVLTLAQEQLRKVGINVELQIVEHATYHENIRKNLER